MRERTISPICTGGKNSINYIWYNIALRLSIVALMVECCSLGKELLSMQHYASNEIKEKLRELTDKRNGMIHR